MRTPRPLLVVAVAALVGGAAGTGITVALGDDNTNSTTTTATAAQSASPAAERSSTTALSARDIYRQASGSVAYITATSPGSSGTGTGFVVASDGLIVTNQHVIDGASDIKVAVGSGKPQRATLVGQDRSSDIALLRIDTGGRKLTALKLADSSKVQIGDATFAIGNPFGLARTLTTGVVSATQRHIDAPNGFAIDNVLQTDAALNPGNSGGPLLNDQGEVIGVNSQIESGSGNGSSSSQGSNTGIGFAVPSNTVSKVIGALQEGGAVTHAYLGVSTSDASTGGATVQSVTAGGPAADAGLAQGAVIVAVGTTPVGSSDDLGAAIDAHRPGDHVKLTIRQPGKSRTVTVTLGTRPATAS
jgi:putative serine protease PepD